MSVIHVILSIIYVILGVAISVVILMQEGKSAGLSGSISGAAETYWGKNKGRSMEGKLEKATRYLVILFFLSAVVLNINL